MRRKTMMYGIALALCCSCLAPAFAGDEKPKAMDFTFEDINPASPTHGKQLSLNELYAERGVVLNFLASWCGYCWKELPILQEMADAGEARVLGMAADEYGAPAEILMSLIAQRGLTLPILWVEPGQAAELEKRYTYQTLPATYLIDAQGIIASVLTGAVQPDRLRAEVERALGPGTAADEAARAEDPAPAAHAD